jgi:hypothetical protein
MRYRTITIICIYTCLASAANAQGLLDGYYQVTSLIISQDGKPQRGFNNSDLYIAATDKRVRIAGAWRGYPMAVNMAVERITGDTMQLRDTQNPSSYYKFQVKHNTISGRHALSYEDGTRSVMEMKAVVRKLNRDEADRVRTIIGW